MPLLNALTAPEATLYAALVAAVTTLVVSTGIKFFLDDLLMRRKARTDYEYEQRKALRQTLGRYQGPLVDAAESLHYRMLRLYEHPDPSGLVVNGSYPAADYFYRSTVYRFLAFFRLVVALEREALYLDPRISDPKDLLTLRYTKALRWVMTDGELVQGAAADDHFQGDRFRALSDVTIPDGKTFDFGFFESDVLAKPAYTPVFAFFDGLGHTRTPHRWDRLVAMHLLLLAFMSTAGYDAMHRIEDEQLRDVARQFANRAVAAKLETWFIPEMCLQGDPQAKRIIAALNA